MSIFTKEPGDELASGQAKTLYDGLKAKRVKGLKRDSVARWESVFTSLNKEQTPELVTQTLAWYAKHLGEEFVPTVINATMFKFKFLTIVRLMETSEDGMKSEFISDRTNHLVSSLSKEFTFPPEITTCLPIIVERSRKNWTKFCTTIESLTKAKDSRPTNDRENGFLEQILNFRAAYFVQEWVRYLHQRYGNLTNFLGKPLSLVWKQDNKWFYQSFWWKWSLDWCGDSTLFDKLLEKVIEENNK